MSNSIGGIKRQKQYLHLENRSVFVSSSYYLIGKWLHCSKNRYNHFYSNKLGIQKKLSSFGKNTVFRVSELFWKHFHFSVLWEYVTFFYLKVHCKIPATALFASLHHQILSFLKNSQKYLILSLFFEQNWDY